jgi:hypothetical protein
MTQFPAVMEYEGPSRRHKNSHLKVSYVSSIQYVFSQDPFQYHQCCLRQLVAGLSPQSRGFASGLVHVVFIVDKVALGQGFPRVGLLRFSLSILFYLGSILIYHLGMNNRAVGGCSSETQSRPIDTNNTNIIIIITANAWHSSGPFPWLFQHK